jgi:hypothetical protein
MKPWVFPINFKGITYRFCPLFPDALTVGNPLVKAVSLHNGKIHEKRKEMMAGEVGVYMRTGEKDGPKAARLHFPRGDKCLFDTNPLGFLRAEP